MEEKARGQALMIHDFDRVGLINNLGGISETWKLDAKDASTKIYARLDPEHKIGTSGCSLFLSYKLSPDPSLHSGLCGFRTELRHLDARAFDHLEFWIKGDPERGFGGGLKVEFRQAVPGAKGEQFKASYMVKSITGEWQKVAIPLTYFTGIQVWKDLEELLLVLQPEAAAVRQGAYYIDNLAFVRLGSPGPSAWQPVETPGKTRLFGELGEKASSEYLRSRLGGWPGKLLVERSQLPSAPKELLSRIAADTWRGIAALTDDRRGLPLDSTRFGVEQPSVDPASGRINAYTSMANIGLYLMAVVAAMHLGLLAEKQARSRLSRTLGTIEKLERFEGFFYNRFEAVTLERASNQISFTDSLWLTAALIVLRNSFTELSPVCSRLIDQASYSLFYNRSEQFMAHGYHPKIRCQAEYKTEALFMEPRLGSAIAIGKGDVPVEHWFRMFRTFPEGYAWQPMKPLHRVAKQVLGCTFLGGYYEWEGIRYVPSWGGSMAEALMPTLVLDEAACAPNNLGRNGWIHADIHRRYATQVLKYPVWGMSPCLDPSRHVRTDYGVRVLGSKGYEGGAVAPYASILAIQAMPEAVAENLRRFIDLYDIYGGHGFYDSVDPASGRVAYAVTMRHQCMILIALGNHLAGRCIQRSFMADPIARKAIPVMEPEDFFS